ncbi:MAG TPA: carboxypeptidase regulatory-like domain-containing protein [Gemmatimonadaceae bacterium]
MPSRIIRKTLGLLAIATLVSGAESAAAQTGRIEGTATISRRLITVRQRIRMYDEPGSTTARPRLDDHPFANVVLYLEEVRGGPVLPKGPSEMRQWGERFMPHVLPVVAGSTVRFPNEDPIYHNVFSLSRARTFDLGRYARGSSKNVVFPAAGLVQVFCHIHADMSGYILVLDNPFFVQPDENGRFALDGIPPGEYRLVAWHERARPNVTTVRVTPGRATFLNITIPIVDTP